MKSYEIYFSLAGILTIVVIIINTMRYKHDQKVNKKLEILGLLIDNRIDTQFYIKAIKSRNHEGRSIEAYLGKIDEMDTELTGKIDQIGL